MPGFATGGPEGGGPRTGGLYDGFTGGHGADRQQTLRTGAVKSIALRVGGGEQVMPRIRGGGSLQAAGTGGVVHRAVALTGANLQPGTRGDGFVKPAGAPLQGAVDVFAGQSILLALRRFCGIGVPCGFGVLKQFHAQAGCQRGGQGASGAVRIAAVQARGAYVRAGAIREDRGVTGVLTAQVAALHNHGGSSRRCKVRRLLMRLIKGLGGLLLTEHGELRNVRGNHIHERHEVAQRLLRFRLQQAVTARSNHDRVEHHHGHGVLAQPGADGTDCVRIAEHTDFYGVNRDVIKNGGKLRGQKFQGRGEYFTHSAGVLGNQ